MSAAPATTVETNNPDPQQDRPAPAADKPSPTSRLLTLVRALIDYGKQLASTLQQRTATTDIAQITRNFGTINIAQILACITRGLHRAAELEARLEDRIAREPAAPATYNLPSLRQPRTPEDPGANAADTGVAHLPTPEHIAAELRRRPIGAILADICRDLGIVPASPLWNELSLAVLEHGGNLVRLFDDTCNRVITFTLNPPAPEPPAEPAPYPPSAAPPASTGPP